MGDESVLRLRDGLVIRDFDGEAIILDTLTSTYLSINPSGRVIWRQLEGGATQADIIRALEAEFEVDRARAVADVGGFVELCRRRGFLRDDTLAD